MPARKAATRPRATRRAGDGSAAAPGADGATTEGSADGASAEGSADGTSAPAAPGRAGAPAQGRALRARGRRTLRNLLDAGIEVFSTRGYHAARVDDIVKAAATSHGTFYLYFANKEDLFQALIADVAEQMAGLAGSLGPVTPDAAGRAELADWLGRFTEMYAHYGPILRTWTEAEIDTSAAGRIGTDLLGDLAAAVADRIVRQARPPAGVPFDRDLAALALVAMIERFNYFVLSGQVDAHRDELSDTLAGVVHAALFGSTAASAGSNPGGDT